MRDDSEFAYVALPDVLTYPVRGRGLLTLVVGVIPFLALTLLTLLLPDPEVARPWWLVNLYEVFSNAGPPMILDTVVLLILVPALVYIAGFLMKIMISSLDGGKELPDWPDPSFLGDECLRPCFWMVGTAVVCHIPSLLFYGESDDGGAHRNPIFVFLWSLGMAYYPVALIAVVMHQSIFACNPVRVVGAFLKAPLHCAVVVGFVWGIGLVTFFAQLLLGKIPYAGHFLRYLVTLYAVIVVMRVLGLMYRCAHRRLGWFERA